MLIRRKLALTLAFAGLLLVAFGAGCRGFFTNPTIVSIAIGPTGVNLAPGATLQMVATGTPSDNSQPQIITGKCFWNSSNPSAASVGENNGFVTAATTIANPPQTVTITASYQALTPATATLSICPVVDSLTITASQTSFPAGTTPAITFTAEAVFSGTNGSQNVTDEVTWNISNTAVISSISDGTATIPSGTTSGTSTQVTATLCSFTSPTPVTITVN